MKKIIATLLLTLSATASHAIGPEAVIGALIGGIIIGQATADPYPPPPPYTYYAPPPPVSYHAPHAPGYYYQPRPVRQCFTVPLFDAYGRHVRNTRQCHYVPY